ncbi:MAG TPA: 4-hydroxythreonine-4-phosphate dehydrogenase PdxA, partial [Verrucomicrobiales bacterium]|nr:4-hydroxythreonine-4-phosphate dehydrogenase PdxA [Verrucomicrobiales bacterium]
AVIDADGLTPPSRVQGPSVVEVSTSVFAQLQPGKVSAFTGAASFAYINRAIDAALAGHVAAVTTAPINKEGLRRRC